MAEMTLSEALEDALQRSIALDAPLDARLGVIRDSVRELSPPFAEAVDRMVTRLQSAKSGEKAPARGDIMPNFILPDENGKIVSLAGLLRAGPVVVAFHRGHWCPYCRLNAVALGEVSSAVTKAGGRIVAIAPDRRQYNEILKADGQGAYSVLTDIDNGYAMSLNLAIWVGDEMQTMMAGAGFDLPTYQDNRAWMLPVPATFIVGTDGKIVERYVEPDYRQRMDIDALLNALKSAH